MFHTSFKELISYLFQQHFQFMHNISMWRIKRAQKGRKKLSLAARFLGTKIPQGVILPAAWICNVT